MGMSQPYGARPLKRFITREVETPLAKEIVSGRVMPKQKSRLVY